MPRHRHQNKSKPPARAAGTEAKHVKPEDMPRYVTGIIKPMVRFKQFPLLVRELQAVENTYLNIIHVSTLLFALHQVETKDRHGGYRELVNYGLKKLDEKMAGANGRSVANVFYALPRLGIEDLDVHQLLIEKLFNRAREITDFCLHDIAAIFNAAPKLRVSLPKCRDLILKLLTKVESGISELNDLDLDNIVISFPELGFDIVSYPKLIEKLVEKIYKLLKEQSTDITAYSMINYVHVIAVALFIYQKTEKHPDTVTILQKALLSFLQHQRFQKLFHNLANVVPEDTIKLKLVVDAIIFLLPSNNKLADKLRTLLSKVNDDSKKEFPDLAADIIFDSLKSNYKIKKSSVEFYGAHIVFPVQKIAVIINNPGQYFLDDKGCFQLNPHEQLCEKLLKTNGWWVIRISDIAVKLHDRKHDKGKLMSLLDPCLKPVGTKDSKGESARAAAIKKLNDYCDEMNCGEAAVVKPVKNASNSDVMDEKHGAAAKSVTNANDGDAVDEKHGAVTVISSSYDAMLPIFTAKVSLMNALPPQTAASTTAASAVTVHPPVISITAVAKKPEARSELIKMMKNGVDVNDLAMDLWKAGHVDVAFEYFLAAATKEDDFTAKFNLGCMYATGNGVEKDFEEAKKYFMAAYILGHPEAKNSYDDLCERQRLGITSVDEPLKPAAPHHSTAANVK